MVWPLYHLALNALHGYLTKEKTVSGFSCSACIPGCSSILDSLDSPRVFVICTYRSHWLSF